MSEFNNGEKGVKGMECVAAPEKRGFFARLRGCLSHTRTVLKTDIRELVVTGNTIDAELLEELEARLLMADVGVDATRTIIDNLTRQIADRQITDAEALFAAMREEMTAILEPISQPLAIPDTSQPFVILVIGINGAGKTTTIGKMARRFQAEGKSVLLAAGDTFRAAAVEQLQAWGERNAIGVIAQHSGADSASVIYDAIQAAQARGANVLIADTAGRLHNQDNLMDELIKVKRVVAKLDANAPHEVMLVLDANTGQNALVQAEQFHRAMGVTGITLTKLDGTAKGGIIFSITRRLGLPIRFIGVGEQIDDLHPFAANEFVTALLDIEGTA